MRQSARAIILKDGCIAAIKRNKFGDVYYTLVGGGIEEGETPEEALKREVAEETGLQVRNCRLVFVEDGGRFGRQLVFACETDGDRLQVAPGTVEYESNQEGKNTYEPVWLELEKAEGVTFRSEKLIRAVLDGVRNGFPEQPLQV